MAARCRALVLADRGSIRVSITGRDPNRCSIGVPCTAVEAKRGSIRLFDDPDEVKRWSFEGSDAELLSKRGAIGLDDKPQDTDRRSIGGPGDAPDPDRASICLFAAFRSAIDPRLGVSGVAGTSNEDELIFLSPAKLGSTLVFLG